MEKFYASLSTLLLSAVLCSAGSAQTREETLEKFKELNSQAAAQEFNGGKPVRTEVTEK